MREAFGGDSLGEMKRDFEGYREQLLLLLSRENDFLKTVKD